MKPNPLRDPVSLSVGRRTELISPQAWKVSVNAARTSSSPMELSKPLTKMLVPPSSAPPPPLPPPAVRVSWVLQQMEVLLRKVAM